jgi:hypothetical protein
MFQAMSSRYTNVILTLIALLLAALALRPVTHPAPVLAQADEARYYFEPGTVGIRNPAGGSEGEGKLVVDLRTGDIWAFPTLLAGRGVPYPIDANSSKPPIVKPTLLGRFDLAAMRRVP